MPTSEFRITYNTEQCLTIFTQYLVARKRVCIFQFAVLRLWSTTSSCTSALFIFFLLVLLKFNTKKVHGSVRRILKATFWTNILAFIITMRLFMTKFAVILSTFSTANYLLSLYWHLFWVKYDAASLISTLNMTRRDFNRFGIDCGFRMYDILLDIDYLL